VDSYDFSRRSIPGKLSCKAAECYTRKASTRQGKDRKRLGLAGYTPPNGYFSPENPNLRYARKVM